MFMPRNSKTKQKIKEIEKSSGWDAKQGREKVGKSWRKVRSRGLALIVKPFRVVVRTPRAT
jgi:hypothetical protein